MFNNDLPITVGDTVSSTDVTTFYNVQINQCAMQSNLNESLSILDKLCLENSM